MLYDGYVRISRTVYVWALSSLGFQKLFINKRHIIQSNLCIDCFLSPLLIDEYKSLWCHKWMATSCPLSVAEKRHWCLCWHTVYVSWPRKTPLPGRGWVCTGKSWRKNMTGKMDVCACVRWIYIGGAGEYTSCLRFSSRRSPRSPRNEPRVSCTEHNTLNTKRNEKKCDKFSSELWHFVMGWFYSKENKTNISA